MKSKLEEEVRKAIDDESLLSTGAVEDFARKHKAPFSKVNHLVFKILTEGTLCEGCVHVTFLASGMYPCNSCSRIHEDLYEPDK